MIAKLKEIRLFTFNIERLSKYIIIVFNAIRKHVLKRGYSGNIY